MSDSTVFRTFITPPSLIRQPLSAVWLQFGIDLILVFTAYVMLSIFFTVLWALWGVVGGRISTAPTQGAMEFGPLASMLITGLCVGLPTLGLYGLRHRSSMREYQHSLQVLRQPITWLWIGLVTLLGLKFSFEVRWVSEHLLGIESDPSNELMIREGLAKHPIFTTLFVVILAPLYEEILFRRILFRRFWLAGHPFWGMAITGVLFALVHELPTFDISRWPETIVLWMVYSFLGVAFAGLYWHTQTIWASFIAHALNNATALVILVGSTFFS